MAGLDPLEYAPSRRAEPDASLFRHRAAKGGPVAEMADGDVYHHHGGVSVRLCGESAPGVECVGLQPAPGEPAGADLPLVLRRLAGTERSGGMAL